MTKKLTHLLTRLSLSALTLLTACGGGGNGIDDKESYDVPDTPAPHAGTPADPGEIKIGFYENGHSLSYKDLIGNVPEYKNPNLESLKVVFYYTTTLPPFALAAMNGKEIGIGNPSVGAVDPVYYTEETIYTDPTTGKKFTYDDFAAGVANYNKKQIALSTRWSSMKTHTHEVCHMVDFHNKTIGSNRALIEQNYIDDMSNFKSKGLSQYYTIPKYMNLIENGGLQPTVRNAVPELFAELCAAYIMESKFGNQAISQDLSNLRYIFPKSAAFVQQTLDNLSAKHNKPYAYNITGPVGSPDWLSPALIKSF